MKLGYFSLIMVLIVMFSLGAVVASEDVAGDMSSDDVLAIDNNHDFNEDLSGLSESQDMLKVNPSDDVSDNNCDLIVKIDVKGAYKDNQYNRKGFEVPWTITAIANGTANNVKVHITLSSNLEYLSCDLTDGQQYDPLTKIWDIGDLSNSNASLKILTKLKSDGKFTITANGTSDSADTDLSNNYLKTTIRSGSDKVTSNYTETTDDKEGPSHESHQGSEESSLMPVERDKDTFNENLNTAPSNSGSKLKSDKSSSSAPGSSSGSVSNSISAGNTIDSINNQISNTFDSLSNSIIGLFNPSASDNGDSNSKNASSGSAVKAISVQDYTKIPLLIFALFFIISLPIIAYDKIKS